MTISYIALILPVAALPENGMQIRKKAEKFSIEAGELYYLPGGDAKKVCCIISSVQSC